MVEVFTEAERKHEPPHAKTRGWASILTSFAYLVPAYILLPSEWPASIAFAILTVGTFLFHATDNDQLICYSRVTSDLSNVLLVVVNLDPHHPHSGWLSLDLGALGVAEGSSFQVHDLVGDARFLWRGSRAYVSLDPRVMPVHVFRVRRLVRSEHSFEYYL